jgi:hypothetical protein
MLKGMEGAEVRISSDYLVFLRVYALVLVVASVVVFTQRGQTLVLRSLARLGRALGVGPWGMLYSFGHEPVLDMGVADRAGLAKSYIVSAEEQTLRGARATLWIMIAGCIGCAVAAGVIIGVLPPLVLDGAWSYGAYQAAAMLVVSGTAGGALVLWLVRLTVLLNRTDGCAAARQLLVEVRKRGISQEVSDALASGRYPRLGGLLGHASP